MADPKSYPELLPFLADDIDDIEVETVTNDGGSFLAVTATADDSTDQFLFAETPDGLTDNTDQAGQILGTDLRLGGFQGAATTALHAQSLAAAQAEVGQFQTSAGPGGGSLACVWSLRTILHNALGYWVTQSDGTDTFGAELQRDYQQPYTEDQIQGGGIIISPTKTVRGTKKRIVGHVGILGSGSGDGRLIYSNSSRKKIWDQNYSIQTWKARRIPRGLPVLFYPLPKY